MTAVLQRDAALVRWDLSELYASAQDPAIERALAGALEAARRLEARYRGRLEGMAPSEFAGMMAELEEHYDLIARPTLYAHLLHSLNTAAPLAGRLAARVREATAECGRHLVFLPVELAGLSPERVASLVADPRARVYEHEIEKQRRQGPHRLSETEERLLNDLDPVASSAWVRLFRELCAAIRPSVQGHDVPLAAALALLTDPRRELREEASHAISRALDRDLKTRSYVFNVVLQEHAISDRLRSFPTWLSARNLANEATDASVEALVDAVASRYDLAARYYRVKRGLLGVDRLHEWDRYAPVRATSRELDWALASELVLGAYQDFSPTAGSLVRQLFENPWIDAPVADGKENGAYCAGSTPRIHPFVMLNVTGKLDDAVSLAHEAGHALHYMLASRQHVFDYHPPLTLAESASVFGQTLVLERILAAESDPRVKLSMLCNQVENAIATIFRQVAFSRFEAAVHTRRRQEGELSMDQLGDAWQEQLQAMFGDGLELTPEHRSWWSYIEPFVHTPGYVYAYAFGNLLALSLYRRYQEVGEPFVESYLEVLAAGGSRSPDELVRSLGMDVSDPGFWQAGLAILEGMVGEVERLAADAT